MTYMLQLKLKNMDGVLERVLGVIRYRGYPLLRMMANPTPDGSAMDVTLKVGNPKGDRQLARHLRKLFDVETVEIYGELPQASYG